LQTNHNFSETDQAAPNHPPSVEKPPWRSRYLKWVLMVTAVPVGLLLFSFLGHYSFFAELVCNFRFQLLVAILLAAATIAYLGGYRWAVGLVLVTLLSGSTVFSDYLPRDIEADGMTKISVMSFNILGLNQSQDAVLEVISKNQPDVLVVIEYTSNWVGVFEALHADYPYRIEQPRWHGFGIALFSKFPFSNPTVHRLAASHTDSPMMVASFEVGGDVPLRVAAAHLLAPMGFTRMSIRNQQIQELIQRLPADSQPTVLVGDFNCVPWSPYLNELSNATGLRDSRRGFGYQGSWPSDFWPMRIPIDHAFVSDNLSVLDRKLIKDPTGSDHFPLLLELGF